MRIAMGEDRAKTTQQTVLAMKMTTQFFMSTKTNVECCSATEKGFRFLVRYGWAFITYGGFGGAYGFYSHQVSGKVAAISLVISLLFPRRENIIQGEFKFFSSIVYRCLLFVCGNQFESCIIIQNWL